MEILDVVIGLTFVYLLLSLLASALNEYITAVMNLRGKELARGLGRLLDDLDEKDALKTAFDGIAPSRVKETRVTDRLTERFYNHRLIRPLATRRGWLFRWLNKEPRLPSYIPARTFALALLDVLGVRNDEATVPAEAPPGGNAAAGGAGAQPTGDAAETNTGRERTELLGVLAILKREAPHDVQQALVGLEGFLASPDLPSADKLRLLNVLTGSQTRLQSLHDSLEVWFNNAMDRVSGAYKRTVQGWLFVLGLLIASCSNADTIDMWRRLAENDDLRAAMARRAAATVEQLRPVMQRDTTGAASATADTSPTDTTQGGASGTQNTAVPPRPADSPAPVPPRVTLTSADTAPPDPTAQDTSAVRKARANYEAARARLDSMELKLGWTVNEAVRVGLLRKDAPARQGARPRAAARPAATDTTQAQKAWISPGYHLDLFPVDTKPGFLKLLGLLMTGIAISLGAPFWFDLLNKVISIRAAGRSPEEKPKSPEGGPKRPAEATPK